MKKHLTRHVEHQNRLDTLKQKNSLLIGNSIAEDDLGAGSGGRQPDQVDMGEPDSFDQSAQMTVQL